MDISELSPLALSLIPAPGLVRFVLLIVHPAILPPSNKTLEPVTSPSSFTLNLDVLMNIYRGSSTPPCSGLPLMKILVPDNEEVSILNPPILPELAVMEPSNTAPLANRTPSLSTPKFGPILI